VTLRKFIYGLLAVLVIAAGAFLILGPGIVEGGMNRVVATPLPATSERARALHPRLAIADMHADTLLWQRSLIDPASRARSTFHASRRAMSRSRSSRR
jgi:hypothetical protein